jgi:hypothetical protein
MCVASAEARFRLGRLEKFPKDSRGAVGVAGSMDGMLLCLVDGRSARPEMVSPLGSGGKKLSRGVWGEGRSNLSILGLTECTDAILVRSTKGDGMIGIESALLANAVGWPTHREVRDFAKEEDGVKMVFGVDFGLRVADGESSIALSLSRSTLPGDAKTGDNLLLDGRMPALRGRATW